MSTLTFNRYFWKFEMFNQMKIDREKQAKSKNNKKALDFNFKKDLHKDSHKFLQVQLQSFS